MSVLSRVAGAMCLVLPLAAVAGCRGGDDESGTSGPSGTIVVLAASSLTEPFRALGMAFEAEHPGTTVSFSFAASADLAAEIERGAPADVFAAGSPATMAQVSDAVDTAGEPVTFIRDTLEIAVPAGNPAKVTGLADFATKDLTIALCAPTVPCGAAADKVLAAAKVAPAPDTREAAAAATVAKVTLGAVDAALVYKTDVIAAGDKVEGIDFPEAASAVTEYPIAVLAGARMPATAQAFVDLVMSAGGQKVLTEAGFQLP